MINDKEMQKMDNKPLEVIFKFSLGRGVITPLCGLGYMHMCAADRRGNSYLVQTDNGNQWFFEEDLMWPDEF